MSMKNVYFFRKNLVKKVPSAPNRRLKPQLFKIVTYLILQSLEEYPQGLLQKFIQTFSRKTLLDYLSPQTTISTETRPKQEALRKAKATERFWPYKLRTFTVHFEFSLTVVFVMRIFQRFENFS